MIAKLLSLLHQRPVESIGVLFVMGMALIFGDMVYLSKNIKQDLALQYAETYVQSLDAIQAMYSSNVVARVKHRGIQVRPDYLKVEGAIPPPATLSIELAAAMTNPDTGISTRLYSDYPFAFRLDGGPKDEYERSALTTLRSAEDKNQPYVRFEDVDGRWSLRYGKALVMNQSCVNCHNSHPDSPRKNWKIGDVRGVREVVFPLDGVNRSIQGGWAATLAVMLIITLTGLGIIFLVVQALRSSISMLSRTNSAYDRFVPHEFLNYLKKQSIVDVQLNDNIEKEMTLLFSDMRSFTNMSENMTPEESFQFVNDYLSMMGPVVRSNGGFIDKYIGDAIMALFDDTDDAVKASMEMLEKLGDYNRNRITHDQPPISIGIGLHKGKLRLGTVGEHHRMDGTVISDAVNLASRIEGLTKLYGVSTLITEDIYRSLQGPERLPIRLIDKVKVKGKNTSVTIYEIFAGDSPERQTLKLELQEEFEQAISLYQATQFEEAKTRFEACLARLPDDRPARLYVERCDLHIWEGVEPGWEGALPLGPK